MIVKNFAFDVSSIGYKTEIALAGKRGNPTRAVPGANLVISQIV